MKVVKGVDIVRIRDLSPIRAVLFAFAVHVLSIFNMILYVEGATKDIGFMLVRTYLGRRAKKT